MPKNRGLISGFPDHARRLSGMIDNDDNLALSTVVYQPPPGREVTALGSVTNGPNADDNVSTIYWRPDGKMLFWWEGGDRMRRMSCTTPWDPSTGTVDQTYYGATKHGLTANYTFWFRRDGLKVYFADQIHDGFIEFTLENPWDISESSMIRHNTDFNGIANWMDAGGFKQLWGAKFGDSGNKLYAMDLGGDDLRQYSLSTAYDVTTISYDGLIDLKTNGGNEGPIGFEWASDGSAFWIADVVGDLVAKYTVSNSWDITSGTITEVQTFSVAGQESAPTDITWKPDGTKFFVTGLSGNGVDTYTCSTAFDISTATHSGFRTLNSRPMCLQFNNDGTQFIYCRDATSVDSYVYVVDCSTPYDMSSTLTTTEILLTTNHWDRNITPTNVNGQTNTTYLDGIRAVTYSNSGTKLTVIGARVDGTDHILQFHLKTSYDATSYYDGIINLRSYSTTNTDFKAMHVSPDGTLFSAFDRATQRIVTVQTTVPWLLGTRSVHHTNLGRSEVIQRATASVDDLGFYFFDDGVHVAMFDKTKDVITIHRSNRPPHRYDDATFDVVSEITAAWLFSNDDQNNTEGYLPAGSSNRQTREFVDDINAFQVIYPPTGPEIFLMDEALNKFFRVPLRLHT